MVETSFTSEIGEKIVLTLEEGSLGKSDIVLLFHGIFVDREENGRFIRLSRILCEKGLSSARIDLPGHGKSDIPSERATIGQMAGQLASTYRWAIREGYGRIHVVPSSFSGALFSMIWPLLDQSRLSTLFLLNPVLDFTNVFVDPSKSEMRKIFSRTNQSLVAQQGYFYPQPNFMMSDAFWSGMLNVDVPSAYSRINRDHTVVHGNADELVDYSRAKEIAINNRYCEFVEIEGGVHAFTQSGDEEQVWKILVGAIEKNL